MDADIVEASHEIAEFAVAERDNVNMYSAVREKVVEVLTRIVEQTGGGKIGR